MDNASEFILGNHNLCPALAAKARALADDFFAEYIDDHLVIVQGWRSHEDQANEWAKGRTIPNVAIVTNAPPLHSMHEFGLAVDVCPHSLLPIKGWDPDNPKWAWLAKRGEVLGLTAGAHFVHVPPDQPHFQLTGSFPASPTDLMRKLLLNVGPRAVWIEAGLYILPPEGSNV